MSDNDELNSILSSGSKGSGKVGRPKKARGGEVAAKDGQSGEEKEHGRLIQWTTPDGNIFIPAGKTVKNLEPGVYDIGESQQWGIYFQKIKVNTHNLIKFPDSRSEKVVTEIEHFWERREAFKNRGDKASIMYKRGICLWGPAGSGKCLGRNTPILMFDGTIKMVQDVKVGDLLMGDDSTPRKVLSLARGKEQMYEIIPTKGDSYIVNESHILSLKRHGRTSKKNLKKTEIVDIEVKDWLKKSTTFKKEFKGYRTGVEFQYQEITVDPYFLGYWLGDGTTRDQNITTADEEVLVYANSYASKMGLELIDQNSDNYQINNKSRTYKISAKNSSGNGRKKNILLTQMQDLNLINNKHIPNIYKINSSQIRLKVLAGLLDSDGSYNKGTFDYVTKLKNLSDDVLFLTRSLGFAAYMKECKKSSQNGTVGNYYRITISGDLDKIPTKIFRKQASPRKQVKDVLVTQIKTKKLKVDDYYGFEIDGNRRFLLGDFTVTHNTCTIQLIVKDVIEKRSGICVVFGHPKLFLNGMRTLRQIHPETKIVVLMEDLDSIIEQHDESEVLNILDGVNAFEDIVYLATTNYPERLGPRIINRPSRFDKRIKIGYPDAACRKIYLESLISKEEIKKNRINIDQWVADTDEFSMAHLKELFVAVVILEDPYKEALENLKSMKSQISSDDTTGKLGFGE